ncbi:P-loop containing nucleoside triphosphate hydrolase [Vibrio phage Va2]|nr:P-loop containing nucleoside triphosphate hydrolase [Vibrio phage Va2]
MLTKPLPDSVKSMVLKHFPFPTARAYQLEAAWACQVAKWQGKKFAVAELPTGIGKSPLGMCVGQLLTSNLRDTYNDRMAAANLPPNKEVVFGSTILTRTRSLQQQYESTEGAAVLWGKSHYSDVDEDNPPDKVHTCGKGCPGMTYEHKFFECPYVLAKKEFFNEDNVGIANNALFLSSWQVQNYPKILVVDECHTFVNALIDYCEIYVNTRRIYNIMKAHQISHIEFIEQCIEYESGLDDGRLMLRKIEKYLINLRDFVKYTVIPPVEEAIASLEKYASDNPRTRKKVKKMEKDLKFLCTFNENMTRAVESRYAKGSWVLWKESEERLNYETNLKETVSKIYMKPMDPLPEVVENIIGDKEFTLFMSATVGDYVEFCEGMGLDPEDGVDMRAPAIFDPENRPVYPLDVASMNYSNREELLAEDGSYTSMVCSIMNQHKGQRGVIHSVSYANAELLRKNVPLDIMKRLYVVPRGTIVNESYIKTLPQDAVIVSPSIAEGVDLRDDLARFQIILKIPFGSLGDHWIKAKLNRSESWYSNAAAIEVAQMIGRVCRTPEDFGATYILDSNFNRIKGLLASYIRDAIK